MAKIAHELLADLDKETVDFVPTMTAQNIFLRYYLPKYQTS
jgi:DNA gyrase/topoisomerase IV subunit A